MFSRNEDDLPKLKFYNMHMVHYSSFGFDHYSSTYEYRDMIYAFIARAEVSQCRYEERNEDGTVIPNNLIYPYKLSCDKNSYETGSGFHVPNTPRLEGI